MTYRQAQELGGQVRKGERSTMVIYYGTAHKREAPDGDAQDGDEPGTYRFLKSYAVFNSDQMDGLPEQFTPKEEDLDAGGRPIERLEAFFGRMGVPVRVGGDVAAYRPVTDDIVMPPHERFEDGELWYATLAHETAHLSGSPGRLDREVARRYHENRACRAEEELIAELAAAMMDAHLGFAGDHIDDHARYIGGWIKALRSDKRLLLKAAAEAQRAVDWMFEAAGVDSDAVKTAEAT